MMSTRRVRTAAIVRTQDGVFQPMLLAAQQSATLYQLTGCVLRKIADQKTGKSITALSSLPEEVFVFVNIPLETTNHRFWGCLTGQAMDQDCGVASGLIIDEKRVIVHSGWDIDNNGVAVDRYAGQVLSTSTVPAIRHVDAVTENLFAVRRARLLEAGGLTAVCSGRMKELVGRLVRSARESGLHISVTSQSVATIAGSSC